jgi:hypothetical protein
MKAMLGAILMALILTGGAMPASADETMGQQEKSHKGDREHRSKKGDGHDKSTGGKRSQKDQEPNAGGPMGESQTGGAGPSGPSPLPPGSSPGFEGATKDKSRGPEMGGPR